MTPMNNLQEPHFQPSGSKPGVSGESMNTKWGPQAAYECGIMEGKEEANMFEDNYVVHGKQPSSEQAYPGRLTQSGMGESSLKP